MSYLISFVLPLIVAIVGVSVPAIASVLQARSQQKAKQLELFYVHRLEAFKRFATTYAYLYDNDSYDRFWEFSAAAQNAVLVSSVDAGTAISQLINTVKDAGMRTTPETDLAFVKCVYLLNEEARGSEYKPR